MSAEIIPLQPQRELPRQPLLNEMVCAYGESLLARTTDPHRSRFFAGLGLGYSIAFGFHDRRPLDDARRTPGSSNVHIDFRRPRGFDTEDTLWACGVRHGYALGTSEQVDADDCALCGERLTEDDDYDQCFDGKFCIEDRCKETWHANGPAMCGDDE